MTYCQKCADSNDGFWGSWVGECDEHGPNAKPKEKIKELTKEEKIKEVMILVQTYAARIERSVSSGDASALYLKEESDAHKAIESKLRELIQ